jgi:myo-inositol-1(or 4)-monophosphatase
VPVPGDLEHIARALEEATAILRRFTPGSVEFGEKSPGDPVTEADHLVDGCLRRFLLRHGEGWLSEETADDRSRLACGRVWIVDPIDGTREFVAGIPEWCVSVGLIEDGRAVAGGICNPATGQLFLGSEGEGLTLNGARVSPRRRDSLAGAVVLASRTETARGEWQRFRGAPFQVVPMGSVAYKLAQVAAGQADATWTLTPKHEWDVAGGVALVEAAGGIAATPNGRTPAFNREDPLLPGLVASSSGLAEQVLGLLGIPRVGGRVSGGRT